MSRDEQIAFLMVVSSITLALTIFRIVSDTISAIFG